MSFLVRNQRYLDPEAEIARLWPSWSSGLDASAREELRGLLGDLVVAWERALSANEPERRPAQHERQLAALASLRVEDPAERLAPLRHAVLGWRAEWLDERAFAVAKQIVDGELGPEAGALEGQSLLNELGRLARAIEALPVEAQRELAGRLVEAVQDARFARHGEGKSIRLARYKRG